MKSESFGQRFGIQLSTMGVQTTAQGSAAVRFAPYIEELREFFASAGLHYGSPEDIVMLTERLESPSFAEDLGSMIRSIVLREHGEMPHSQMLEILALAIGGEKIDDEPQNYSQPLRSLLSFMTSVLRKPWNEPPGDCVHHAPETGGAAENVVRVERGEVVPFPSRPHHGERGYGQAATISAAADRAAHHEKHGHSAPVPINLHRGTHPADPFDDPRMDRKVPDLVGDPTPPERSVFDPATPEDQAFEDPDIPDATSDEGVNSAAALPPAAWQSEAPDLGIVGSPEPPDTHAVPEATLPEPSWKMAAEEVRGAKHADVPVVPAPANNVQTAPAVPPSKAVRWPAASEADTARAFASSQQPPLAPPFSGETAAPVRTALDAARVRSRYTPRVPRTPAGILVAGAAILVLAGIVAAEFHRAPTELTGKQPPSSAGTPLASDTTATAQPAAAGPTIAPSAAPTSSPALTRVRQPVRIDADEDADERGVAPPYSTPIPGQVQPKPTAYVPAAQQPAPVVRSSRPPSDEVASTAPQAGGSSGGNEYQTYASGQPAPHPGFGSSYRGSEPGTGTEVAPSSRGSRSVGGHPNQIEVSPGMMAGYVLSAPKPDYPTLARIAHIGGSVVLQAVVAKNGSVLATHVLSGHRLLRGAAEDAVRRWRFRPYVMDGHPVEVSTIVTVRFSTKR